MVVEEFHVLFYVPCWFVPLLSSILIYYAPPFGHTLVRIYLFRKVRFPNIPQPNNLNESSLLYTHIPKPRSKVPDRQLMRLQ